MTDELRAALDAALPLLRLSPYEGAIEAAEDLMRAVIALERSHEAPERFRLHGPPLDKDWWGEWLSGRERAD